MLYVIIFLFIVSVLWALWSLKDYKKDSKLEKEVKKSLSKGRVIYQKDN